MRPSWRLRVQEYYSAYLAIILLSYKYSSVIGSFKWNIARISLVISSSFIIFLQDTLGASELGGGGTFTTREQLGCIVEETVQLQGRIVILLAVNHEHHGTQKVLQTLKIL
jgi:hypothetical protein